MHEDYLVHSDLFISLYLLYHNIKPCYRDMVTESESILLFSKNKCKYMVD